MKLIIGIAFLVLITQAFFVQGFEIPPGDSRIIFCENCTFNQIEYRNDSIGFTCLNETIEEINATCNIARDLQGGDAIMNFNDPCSVNVTCDASRCGKFQEFEYLNKLSITKTVSEFNIHMEVFDYEDKSVQNWSTNINQDDVVEQKTEYSLICPHEVITDVNMQTCADYLDDIMGTTNPMIFALATGQNECTKMLRDCETDKKSEEKAYLDWKGKFEIEQRARINCVEDLEDMKFNLYNVSGSCYQNKDEVVNLYANYRLTHGFGNEYAYALFILLAINGILGLWYLFGKGDFG